jgi:hypothetical protein
VREVPVPYPVEVDRLVCLEPDPSLLEPVEVVSWDAVDTFADLAEAFERQRARTRQANAQLEGIGRMECPIDKEN